MPVSVLAHLLLTLPGILGRSIINYTYTHTQIHTCLCVLVYAKATGKLNKRKVKRMRICELFAFFLLNVVA